MKLTWFGGATLRIHIGGQILVVDPQGAPAGIDRAELLSGADRVIGVGESVEAFVPADWRPRRARSLLNEEQAPEIEVLSRAGAVLIDALGEPPLLLLTAAPAGRAPWLRDAVVVAFGEDLAGSALELGPRLLALAAPEDEVGRVFAALRERLDGTALVALEPGMALEV